MGKQFVGASGFLSKSIPLHSIVAHILVMVNHHIQRTAKIETVMEENDNMERAIGLKRAQDNLIGVYMGLWGTSPEETRDLLIKFSRSKQIPLKELAAQQSEFSAAKAALNREYQQKIYAITPLNLHALSEYHTHLVLSGAIPGDPFNNTAIPPKNTQAS